MGKLALVLMVIFIAASFYMPKAYAAGEKIAYVDLRRAFYEYEKTKSMETELNSLTQTRQEERNNMIAAITKLRDEGELLTGDAKSKKQKEVDAGVAKLQEFDLKTRQELLNKKNDMFREVVDDIQKVVEGIGKKEGYDYILDSRNVMYAKETFDLTDVVVKQLNKK